ncbi:hypothetical protein [Flammeovirga sp. SJP92]|uniref:hypothetical protein n=1 Tax=Flammeovirga sp. SJP92 TaxID=1775430 RepID=UPI000786F3A8|nr:hypothetical protein [Flammeovirga sp. SJP92]KXX71234.1 hypothetical protein AVL50_09260 [Flammeovirga sp. SJP92]
MKKLIITATISIYSTLLFGQEKLMTENRAISDLIYRDGKLGIGTNSPTEKIRVQNGNILLSSGQSTNSSIHTGVKFSTDNLPYYSSILGYRGEGSNLIGMKFFTSDRVGNLEAMHINYNGFIGIGRSNPLEKLHVYNGNLLISSNNNTNNNVSHGILFTTDNMNYQSSISAFRGIASTFIGLDFKTSNGADNINAMRINPDGSIGINTFVTSGYKLSVNGKIRAEEVKVYTGWADYVFDEDYNLKSLSEVEAHIKEHKHLPDVPSAKEVEENGVNVGETEAMLLRKIEELTLYTIEQEKRLDKQEKLINELLKKIGHDE